MALWSYPSCPDPTLLGLPPSAIHFHPISCMITPPFQLFKVGNIGFIFKATFWVDSRHQGLRELQRGSYLSALYYFLFIRLYQTLFITFPSNIQWSRDIPHFVASPFSPILVHTVIVFSSALPVSWKSRVKLQWFSLSLSFLSTARCTERLSEKTKSVQPAGFCMCMCVCLPACMLLFHP